MEIVAREFLHKLRRFFAESSVYDLPKPITMMKKQAITLAALFAASASAFAGGILTNTNQSISFLRQPAQNAVISVNGAYYNPAGVGFLPDGWQFSLGVQNIHQTRHINSTFAPYALDIDNGGKGSKLYKGMTNVPVLPAFDLSYVHDKFFASMHFGVIGGGGSCDFDNGLGSFEGNIAMVPAVINTLVGSNALGYDVDCNLTGTQFFVGGQFNAGYRLNEHLAVSAGVRAYYIYSHNEGGLRNIRLSYGGTTGPAADVLGSLLSGMGMSVDPSMLGSLFADKELDGNQTGWAFAPILGIDYKVGPLNLAAKYEFNTSIRLKNDTKVNTTGLPQYEDGKDGIGNDMPAILSLGAQYEFTDALRVNLGYNHFFDKSAKIYNPATGANDKTDLIKKNSCEVLAGIEYDINDKFTVSAGGHATRYSWGAGKEFISDSAFYVPSWSTGAGFRYNLNSRLSFDLAAYSTWYSHMTKSMADYNNVGSTLYAQLSQVPQIKALLDSKGITAESLKTPGSDRYFRQSLVLGIGVNYKF